MHQCDELWTEVRFDDIFPDLQKRSPHLATLIIQLGDTRHKLSVKLVGQYSEWQQIDRAVGGRDAPTGEPVHSVGNVAETDKFPGTALYQRSRTSIKNRHPAIKRLIKKHNELLQQVIAQLPLDSPFHPPEPVDPGAYQSRDHPTMLEELYMAEPGRTIPKWVRDRTVRDGIRALHLRQRCDEELVRLSREERNLRTWITRQSDAMSRVFLDPDRASIVSSLLLLTSCLRLAAVAAA